MNIALTLRAGLIAGISCLATAALAEPAGPVTREAVMAAIPQLEAQAREQVSNGGVPGLAIAIVFRDEVVFSGGFGLRSVGQPETVTADTVFQLASLSKPISATVVAALVSDNVVEWDSAIAAIDPDFQLKEAYPSQQVTVRDLFNHRSGLPGDAGNELEALGYTRDEILHRLRLVPPSSSFRAGYSYSNFGLTAGAVAAAKPTGKPWEEVAEEKLYNPLGMNSTSSRYATFLSRPNKAALHIRQDGKWAAALKRDPDAQAPAGGVSSNVTDLAQWMRLELANGGFNGKPLIAADALAATHQPLMSRGLNPVSGASSFYGLGWTVEYGRHGMSWGHAGAFSVGARTMVTLYPEAQLGIVVLTNAFPTGVPEGLADNFFDHVFDGQSTKDWIGPWNAGFAGLFDPAIAAAKKKYAPLPAGEVMPALPLQNYAGVYANDYIGQAQVMQTANGLVLALGPKGRVTTPLKHFNRDLFIYYPTPELPDMPMGVSFTMGPDGRATQVTIEDLDGFGMGVLVRE